LVIVAGEPPFSLFQIKVSFLMAEVDFIGAVHKSTKRDYLGRVTAHDKAECAEVAIQWGRDYWDGERHHGYGGFRYDGRWRTVAEALVRHYGLPDGSRILDVGCGKGFLLYEFTQVLPHAEVHGLDISQYAVENSKEEVRASLQVGHAKQLPFPDQHFDLVVSVNTLHNLYIDELWSALTEIERVGRGAKHLTVESYRNEREKVNLLYWQLTCRAFHATHEWEWIFKKTGYSGDHAFIFFE
jgi:protein-L-isoaspartate(D-aspartate) O-methyltransferase